MRILKFGGSSVSTPPRVKNVIEIINKAQQKHQHIAVVVSAFGGATDDLIRLAQLASSGDDSYKTLFAEFEKRHLDAVRELISIQHQASVLAEVKVMLNELEDVLHGLFILWELSTRVLDYIMSFGERLSAFIVAHALTDSGLEAEFLDARQLVRTDDNYSSAKVDFKETNKNIDKHFANHKKLQVITGFIGSTSANETTTLGRSGSDYTASIFGAALEADEVEIWTDVDGIMTADPRKVKKAFPVPSMTYYEAMELSHFGAKVIFPATMQPVMAKKIPIRVKNTFNPEYPGTIISETVDEAGKKHAIKGISSINNVSLARLEGSGMVGVTGTAGRLFGALAREKVNVILISQASSEHSICFVVDPANASKAKQAVEEEFAFEISTGMIDPLVVEFDKTVIAIVGENMKHHVGTSGRMFYSLGKNGVNISAIAQGSTELNISAVVDKHDEVKAVNALHEGFFLSDKKSLNIFLVGTGLIGKVFLSIIEKQLQKVAEEHRIEMHVVGIANSKKMLFNDEGISLSPAGGGRGWNEVLDQQGTRMNMDEYVQRMKDMNLTNSVFVDCTADDNIIKHYEQIMLSSISIVTPNKRANSSGYDEYLRMKKAASATGVRFLYETNVGAGLPVINTLQDLIFSGDHIIRIEAVLSGTMNFLFSNFKKGTSFSELVKSAKEKGYTEPDPRDDLSGMDVARKILILAREMGLPLELKDIEVKGLVPEDSKAAKTVDEFFKVFAKSDATFEKMLDEAESNKKKLRFAATVENGKATVSLISVDEQHPFYALKGSDNIVSFTTRRYFDNPLIVKGPGAGAEVTAAGVFADVIRIVNYLAPQ